MYDKLTRSDIAKMEKEIEERRLVKRPELIAAVKEARAQGDLSENFEYHAARREKSQNESRITYLENMIKTAVIVEDSAKADEVALNKSVEVYFPEDDETQTFRIVTTIRGNSLKGLISIDSPLGKALLHHKEGDRVHVAVNENTGYSVVIKKVGKAEDDAQDVIKGF
ncbi:MAG TPA: transcription elongation factor GreA [Lachnospiraceae bacterium]|nr:transcription elongation factor GreA [Lachnospiraceae bacterium]